MKDKIEQDELDKHQIRLNIEKSAREIAREQLSNPTKWEREHLTKTKQGG